MIRILLSAFGIISANVILQAIVFIVWSDKVLGIINNTKGKLPRRRELLILIISSFLYTLLHVIQSLNWATFFYLIPSTQYEFSTFTDALYFSLVTFTTLEYGDITLHSGARLLAGFEAINGIMSIGWTTAIMFSLIQNIYKRSSKFNTGL